MAGGAPYYVTNPLLASVPGGGSSFRWIGGGMQAGRARHPVRVAYPTRSPRRPGFLPVGEETTPPRRIMMRPVRLTTFALDSEHARQVGSRRFCRGTRHHIGEGILPARATNIERSVVIEIEDVQHLPSGAFVDHRLTFRIETSTRNQAPTFEIVDGLYGTTAMLRAAADTIDAELATIAFD